MLVLFVICSKNKLGTFLNKDYKKKRECKYDRIQKKSKYNCQKII